MKFDDLQKQERQIPGPAPSTAAPSHMCRRLRPTVNTTRSWNPCLTCPCATFRRNTQNLSDELRDLLSIPTWNCWALATTCFAVRVQQCDDITPSFKKMRIKQQTTDFDGFKTKDTHTRARASICSTNFSKITFQVCIQCNHYELG